MERVFGNRCTSRLYSVTMFAIDHLEHMKEPRTSNLASKVSDEDKRQIAAAAALEGVSVSTFTRNAVVRACQMRIAESVKDPLPDERGSSVEGVS